MSVLKAHLRKNWELVWREDVKNIQRVWGINFFEGVRPFSPIWQTLGDGHEIWQIRRLTLKKILLFMMMISFSWFSEKTANPPYLASFCSNQFGLPMYIMQVSTSRGGGYNRTFAVPPIRSDFPDHGPDPDFFEGIGLDLVTIIHLSAAPNRLVGPPTVATKGYIRYVHFWGGVGEGPKIL